MIIGIDATNLRGGGGVTHLIEILRAASPELFGIKRVVVWGRRAILNELEVRPWLIKRNPNPLESGLLCRILWQRYGLASAAREEGCDVLFVPGGSYAGDFHPVVTMSQNLLPYEWLELRRYGLSLKSIRLLLLRYTQTWGFQRSAGVIFLTNYAKQKVLKVTGPLDGRTVVIAHGMNSRFRSPPINHHIMRAYTVDKPCRMLYVSIIDQYKHQWHVVDAVAALRAEGWPVELDLVGPNYPPAFARLRSAMVRHDPKGLWLRYLGAVPYAELHSFYQNADVGIFASSCENLPITLIETMAAGIPVACSMRGPMPEVLDNAGLYFDPENPVTIAEALRSYLDSPSLRAEKARASYHLAQSFSWDVCADETFGFLMTIGRAYKEGAG